MNDFLQKMALNIKKNNNFYTQYNTIFNTLLPNIQNFNKPIHNIEKHYYRSCIAAESCCNYIMYAYPNYINNSNIKIHNLQTAIKYYWNKVEMAGYNKKLLIITLYNQQIMEEEIKTINNILWLLKRDTQAITIIKKSLEFIEFYEGRHLHPHRKNYRLILSEYL